MARKPKCTVTFVRNRLGVLEGRLMYRGEILNSESVDPGERELVKHGLLRQCKERVAARTKSQHDAGLFFRTLDDLRRFVAGRRR
jgi:hypothetical protein